jgi:hypothetical protein
MLCHEPAVHEHLRRAGRTRSRLRPWGTGFGGIQADVGRRRSLDAKARCASIDSTPRVRRYGWYPTVRVVSRHVTAARMGTAPRQKRCATNKLGGGGGPATSAGISSPSWAGGRCGPAAAAIEKPFSGPHIYWWWARLKLFRGGQRGPSARNGSRRHRSSPSVCTLLARADASRAHCTRYTLK